MKKIAICIAIIGTMLLILPLTVLKKVNVLPVSAVKTEAQYSKKQENNFRVYNKETNETKIISAEDYIFGVVAAEMPALYHKEALKAQAVAAYTYASLKREKNKNNPYDVTTDFSVDQAFITREKAKEKWGENGDKYSEKIDSAVKSVLGVMLTYNNAPANTVYFAVSSGKTENCKDIWGGNLPYLKSVSTEFDKDSPNYKKETVFSVAEIKEKLKDLSAFNDNPSSYFGDSTRTVAGSVKEITVCGKKIKGSDIRSALNLPSANFNVSFKNNNFTFTTYGYGHGVGMSQYGANCLANKGYNYKEILNYFYSPCVITENK